MGRFCAGDQVGYYMKVVIQLVIYRLDMSGYIPTMRYDMEYSREYSWI